MAAPGFGPGNASLHHDGCLPFSRPLSPDHRRTFHGRCGWLLRRRLFLDPGIRRHHGLLVCRRLRSGDGRFYAAVPWLVARAPVPLGPPLWAFCDRLLRRRHRPNGRRAGVCRPQPETLERTFLIRSIAGTRDAYNLDGPSVEEREFAVSTVPLTRQDLDRNGPTLQDARIWDWRALEPQLQQIQGLRPYYTFAGVDIDRYMID